MKPPKPNKRRNPNDTTMRNINALKKRVAVLEEQMHMILEAAHRHAQEKVEHFVYFKQPKWGRK